MTIDLRSKGGRVEIWGRVKAALRAFIGGDRHGAVNPHALARVVQVDHDSDGDAPREGVEERLDALIDRFKR